MHVPILVRFRSPIAYRYFFRIFLMILGLACQSQKAEAFWLLNFQTASTLAPGTTGFISGTGGQYTAVGDPATSNFTPFLAHAGIRTGLTSNLDIGYRLCTVPLPYSSVGPSLGSEVDAKVRLTPVDSDWQLGVIGGLGYSYLVVSSQTKDAWAPGVDAILSHSLTKSISLSWNARYVYTEIPSAPNGVSANNVQAMGGSMGAKFSLTPTIAVLPELGLFDFNGSIAGKSANGWGLQYGVVLSALLLP